MEGSTFGFWDMLMGIISAIRAETVVACVEELAVCRFFVVPRVRQVEGDSLLEPFRAAE